MNSRQRRTHRRKKARLSIALKAGIPPTKEQKETIVRDIETKTEIK